MKSKSTHISNKLISHSVEDHSKLTICDSKKNIIRTIAALISAPLITFLVFAIIFSQNNIYPFGDKSIAWCDLKQQGIPLLMNFYDILHGDGSILYSFNNASGMNFIGVFLFFISNPFSLLCIFFDKHQIYRLVDLLAVLKLCTVAFTASVYFIKCHKKLDKVFVVALSVSYSLCAYGLMYFQNIMWLDMMYLYPLLALGIHKVVTENKYALYDAILALCVIFNFYISFMVIIAILLIIGAYLFFSDNTMENKRNISLAFFKGSALAAMISAVSWIPAFLQYSSSGRGRSVFDTLADSKLNSNTFTTTLLLLSSVIILIGFFTLHKPDLKRIITFILFTLFFIPLFIDPINKMWHTGSYMAFPSRYAFITVFTGLELVALALEKKSSYPVSVNPHCSDEKITADITTNNETGTLQTTIKESSFFKKLKENCTLKKVLNYVIPSLIGIVCIKALYDNVSIKLYEEKKESFKHYINTLWGDADQLKVTLGVALTFALIYIISMILYKLKFFPKRIFSLFLLGVVTCEGVFAVNAYMVTAADYNYYDDSYTSLLDLEGKIDDEDFYRIKSNHQYHDSNLLGALGYNSIGHYTSLTNLEYMNTAKALGYSSSWMEISTYGGTELSNAIMSVKYNVEKRPNSEAVYSNDQYSIVETLTSLGLGVKYGGEDDVFSYDEYSRIDFQEKIFQSLFDSEQTLFSKYTPEYTRNCDIKTTSAGTEINGIGEIVYRINVDEQESLYFDGFGEFSNQVNQTINRGFMIYVNGRNVVSNGFPDKTYTGLVYLGTFNKGQSVTVRIKTQIDNMQLYSFGVAGLKTNVLKDAVENTESGYLTAEDRTVSGTVDGKEGEYLFVSIPYDDGFKVTVNGEQVETEKVFGDFYSIPLTDGKNDIRMKYTSPGFTAGVILSLMGLLGFVSIYIYERKKAPAFEIISKACPTIFNILFIGVLLFVYIIPVIINICF